MNQKLKQAMDATRSGHTKEAQLLLTQILQENPNEPQAWYLLSMLVESENKKISYLEKVITLNPSHQKAQEQLTQLNPIIAESEPTLLPQSTFDVDVLTPSEETIPDWIEELEPEADSNQLLAQEEADDEDEEALPDWLKEPAQDNWIESEQPTLISEPTKAVSIAEDEEKPYQNNEPTPKETDKISTSISEKPTSTPTPASSETKQKSPASLDSLLYLLVIGAVITFLMFTYMLFTTYFSG